jgi:hypothetical protein
MALFRDFTAWDAQGGHPDFMSMSGLGHAGCVKETLVDGKPALSGLCGKDKDCK